MQINSKFTAADAAEQQGLAVFWHYLSQVFMDIPDHAILDRTRELLPFIKEMGSFDDNAAKAEEKLTAFLGECADLGDDTVDELLNMAYTALFYLDTPTPATESAWLSPEGLIMQEQWEQVMLTYKAHAFNKPEGYPEPEDHIGLEFLFLAALSRSIADLPENKPLECGGEAESLMASKIKFLDGHLRKWVGMFAGKVIDKSRNTLSLYAGAALLALAVTELEKQL